MHLQLILFVRRNNLPRRRFQGSSFFIPPHKRLLNRRWHSFPRLSQSHCTFQILESWPWPQGNLIITWSASNTRKAFWPLINVRFRAAKIRFSQNLEYSMHFITLTTVTFVGRDEKRAPLKMPAWEAREETVSWFLCFWRLTRECLSDKTHDFEFFLLSGFLSQP